MATVCTYETKKGKRYEVRYRMPNGRQTRKRGFPTKIAATTYATKIESSKLDGLYIAPAAGRTTVDSLAKSWSARQGHQKESWRTRQESLYRVHVAPEWGDRAVKTITSGEVKDWIGTVDRSASTVQDIHGVLVAILDIAVDERRIPVNPARGVKLPRREHTDHEYLTHKQVDQLAQEVSHHGELVYLLAYTGLRWGEMAALRRRDIDLDRRRIHVTRSASKVNSRSVIGATKTWEQRSIAVPRFVSEMIATPVAATPTRDALVWHRDDGTPLRPPTTTHWLIKAVYRLAQPLKDPKTGKYLREPETGKLMPTTDFPIVSAHDLRHTAASLMIASGADVKTVQNQLGHKTASMTLDNYGHLFDSNLDGLADRLDAIRDADTPE